jgi:Flp pilus assembly protein CpaB
VSSRRTLILLGAILIGVIAAFALFNYVSGIEDRANEEAELVEVFKAEETIPKGLTGQEAADDGQIAAGEIPREFRPEGYVSNIDEIASQVALFDIPAGTALVREMFVDPSQAVISFRNRLKEDGSRVAISFQVDQTRGVADLLVPGDYINIFVKVEEPSEGDVLLSSGLGAGCPKTIDQGGCVLLSAARMFYQDVHILAIGQTPVLTAGESTSTGEEGEEGETETQAGLITVDVPIDAAQWIASMTEGTFYLTLNPENYTPEPVEPLNPIADVLPGEDPAVLTPYGPSGDEEE